MPKSLFVRLVRVVAAAAGGALVWTLVGHAQGSATTLFQSGHLLSAGRNPLTIAQQPPGNFPAGLENSAAVHVSLQEEARW